MKTLVSVTLFFVHSRHFSAISRQLPKEEIANQIRDDIVQLPGVTQASVANTRPYEISIEVSEESLRRNNLTFDQVARAVRSGASAPPPT